MIPLFFFHLGLDSGLSLLSWLGPLGLLACSDPCLAALCGAHTGFGSQLSLITVLTLDVFKPFQKEK